MAERDFFAEADRLVREAQRVAEDAVRAGRTVSAPMPPELTRQLADALRELLIALRAILDYSIARLERSASEPVRVEDIPVD